MPRTAIDLAPPMPIYEYLSESPDEPGSSCRICSKGFELFRTIDREALEKCPHVQEFRAQGDLKGQFA